VVVLVVDPPAREAGPSVFHHETLDVYKVALELNGWAGELLDTELASCKLNVCKQLDRAASSIPLNIAEGNGKRSSRDQARYLDIARGSALECAACLDTLVVRRALKAASVPAGKRLLERIVGMLVKMTMRILGRGAVNEADNDDDNDNDHDSDHDHEHDHDHGRKPGRSGNLR
jgi:four helix bundle protein